VRDGLLFHYIFFLGFDAEFFGADLSSSPFNVLCMQYISLNSRGKSPPALGLVQETLIKRAVPFEIPSPRSFRSCDAITRSGT
jgi:hypothetical protein